MVHGVGVGANEMVRSNGQDSDAYLAKIRKVLKKPDSEADRFRRTQFLRAADAWLADCVTGPDGTQRIALLHVKVLRALGEWVRVVTNVRSRAWKGKRIHARALLEAATAHIGLQEFASADRCLSEALALDPELAARAAKTRVKLQSQLRMDLYGRLSAHMYEAIRSRQAGAAKHLYMAASHVQETSETIAREGVGVLSELEPGDHARESAGKQPVSTSGACRVIMTCGSGYSGTGAVTAYLREFEGLPMPFGTREIAVLKKNYGLSRLLSRWRDWTAEERELALQQMVLQAILGVPCYESAASVNRLYTRSITLNSLFMGEELNDACGRTLGVLAKNFVRDARRAVSVEKLEQASAGFLNGVLRMKGGTIALLNNCIHQTQIDICRLLENSRVIVIVRDPRDQYVAHQTETPGKGVTVEAFIKKRKRADAAVSKYLESGATNVRAFGFEAFVTRPEVREEVRNWAGLGDFDSSPKKRFFFPEKSSKNVGIHTRWKNKSDIRMIESELEGQLVDP